MKKSNLSDMSRRKVLLGSGIALTTALAGCSSDETGDGNGSEEDADLEVVYNYRRYDRLAAPNDEGWYFESDEEEDYIGVQVEVTNQTREETSVRPYEFSLIADGSTDDVSFHSQSLTEDLDSVAPVRTPRPR